MNSIKSLDQLEKELYNPQPSPMDSEVESISLKPGRENHVNGSVEILLDKTWEMAEGGNADRVYLEWDDSIPVEIPGSVHTALMKAGLIPDPYIGKNDIIAREKSFKTWWFKCTFSRPEGTVDEKLVFEGVCESCTVWLNGKLLGSHKGMFGGPEFDIGGILKDENTLIVKLNPAPNRTKREQHELNGFFDTMNVGWLDTVVFNCVYGWHYANIPAIGIWRSVKIIGSPAVNISNPFVATRDVEKGIVDLCSILESNKRGWSGKLTGTIEPDNFSGQTYSFEYPVTSDEKCKEIHLRFTIPEPKLWWPVDLGEQNLYRLTISFIPEDTGIPDLKELKFGIRTIEMEALPRGPYPDKYNWTFVVNGKPVFLKGTNWCTIDALMRFDMSRYDRFLTLAKEQHIQFMRAWGGGMPETDEFYELCDRKGIAILQEWPTSWDSEKLQPAEVLKDTVIRNVLRLRNHPSLFMWGGGNESADPTDAVMDMIGRLCYELDGTRPFHRNDPWGGSVHNYDVYWGMKPLDNNLSFEAVFIGEFGLACAPNFESVQRYLPEAEKNHWPPFSAGSFNYHTPVFNTKEDMKLLSQYVPEFIPNNSMQNFILGTQMAQATGIRHTLELARTRWPQATGICYYKLTDVYPACSWSAIDWYGVPKLSHYIFQDSYQPLHSCVIFSKLNFEGEKVSLPVFLLDDADALNQSRWNVKVRVFGSDLDEIASIGFTGEGSINSVLKAGSIELDEKQTLSNPLLIVSEIIVDEKLKDRTFYWTNYKASQGCLFKLPATKLSIAVENDRFIVTNSGSKPAVAVHFDCEAVSDILTPEDNFFWLDAGETRIINTNCTDIKGVKAWNSGLACI